MDSTESLSPCARAVLVALLPVLVPLVLVVLVQAIGAAIVSYVKTGQWPRNEAFIARMRRRREGS